MNVLLSHFKFTDFLLFTYKDTLFGTLSVFADGDLFYAPPSLKMAVFADGVQKTPGPKGSGV